MPYITSLGWVDDLSEYSPEEQKVLYALSHDTYKWRRRGSLIQLTRLNPKELDGVLAGLLKKGVIMPSINGEDGNIIYGLKERVG